jgi:hypothetical protein
VALTRAIMLIPGRRFEPAIPRRKKHPELAYKTHEFLAMSEAGGSDDSLDATVAFDRARVSTLCPAEWRVVVGEARLLPRVWTLQAQASSAESLNIAGPGVFCRESGHCRPRRLLPRV